MEVEVGAEIRVYDAEGEVVVISRTVHGWLDATVRPASADAAAGAVDVRSSCGCGRCGGKRRSRVGAS